MLIFVQISLLDTRRFTDSYIGLLNKPAWPSPKPYKEFVKASGQIIVRNNGGLDNWIGENYICKINKGIKIADFEYNNLKIKNISKHQYTSSEGILSKYVFVFKTPLNKIKIINKHLLESIVDKLINCNISIRNSSYQHIKTTFKNFHKDLKNFHIITTTKNGNYEIEKDTNLIKLCTPQIYFLLDKHETFSARETSVKSFTKNGIFPFKIFSYWLNINSHPYKIWIHKKNTSSALIDLNRNLRITLLRIHAEFECLNFVLKDIAEGKLQIAERSPESNKLQDYINTTISSILKEKGKVAENIGGTNSMEYFKEIFYQFQPGDYDTLVRRIKQINFRPQIERKALVYIDKLYSQNLEIMKNKFTNSQIGAVGENAKVKNTQFSQTTYNIPNDIDYKKLITELNALKDHIAKESNLPFNDIILDKIEEVKQEAEKENGFSVVKFLKSGGKWMLDMANKVGANLIAEIIKSNM